MIVVETVIVAFSMFSALPMPRVDWNERNLRYSLCAFPLVGAMVGLVCWGWVWLCERLGLAELLRGAGLSVLPVLLTGGIHLDGFADTWDALSSHASPERKREILKDPRLGAFAAIHLGVYFIAVFALWTELPRFSPAVIVLLFTLSRTLSGWALTVCPLAPGSGLARSFAEAADRRRVRIVLLLLALCLIAGLFACGAWVSVLMAGVVFGLYYHTAVKRFGGLSGDLAGWFLQLAELGMLAGLYGMR